MTDKPPAVEIMSKTGTAAHLESDAISMAQDTVIGMASSAPAGTVAATLALLAVTTAFGAGPVILLTAVPMLIIADAYRRLNLWNANAGASFEWVGRSINPYLGFMTGWLMIAGYVIGTIAEVIVLGPSVLTVLSQNSASVWGSIVVDTVVCLVMLVIAVVGIKITARTQVGMAAIEYAILIGFSVVGLWVVLHHHAGTFPITWGWFSLSGIGGKGGLAAGLLLSVFMYAAWDGTLYVNEEVKRRRVNPGRAAVLSVALLTVIYTLAQVGLQGVTTPAKLAKHETNALVYVAGVLGGSGWAKVMAVAVALSVIATVGTGIVLTARIIYGMAGHRVLPPVLASVSPRYLTPVWASVLVGVLITGITWVYLLATSLQNVFSDVINISGLMFSLFYIMTALATITYYRRRITERWWNVITLGVLPLGAAAFLGWIVVESVRSWPLGQVISLTVIFALGLVMMFVARFALSSPFFTIKRESYRPEQ